MKMWKIWAFDLQPLFIKAYNFDDAIAKARKINKNYNIGQLVDC